MRSIKLKTGTINLKGGLTLTVLGLKSEAEQCDDSSRER